SVEPARDRGRAIGAILVEQGRLNANDVDEIQRFAGANGLRFGDAAVKMGLLSRHDIELGIAQQYNYPIVSRGGEHGVSDEVIAAHMPQSETAEALRALRTQLNSRWVSKHKTLVVTSPGRGEGRSWLAANLATVFAQVGKRTLLIDADMRFPRQHHLFNINSSVGLSALLTGRAGREIVTRIHPQLRLFVLGAGTIPPNPQELLGRPVFDLVLEMFSAQYDFVVIDTPAACEVADAHVIASRVDAAIILARKNHTRQSQLLATMKNMTESGVNVLGSVITEH
ncbi:MAG TPA: polysaccharide biosynthesis tyrosine autokinase, partial [Steroidobacteraceae bacterium]